jgi:hypothetical protein
MNCADRNRANDGRTNEKEKKIDKQIKAYIVNGIGCKQSESCSALYCPEDKQTEKRESSRNHVNHLMNFSYKQDKWAKRTKKYNLCKQSYCEYGFQMLFFLSSSRHIARKVLF